MIVHVLQIQDTEEDPEILFILPIHGLTFSIYFSIISRLFDCKNINQIVWLAFVFIFFDMFTK